MSEPTADREDAPAPSPEPASDPAADAAPLADQTFTLRLQPPVRALAIGSLAAVAGAVIIVASNHAVLTVLGVVLLVLGVLLAGAALVLTSRLRTTVRMSDAALEVTRAGRTGRLTWSDVERVEEGPHQLIAIGRGEARDLVIAVPGPRRAGYDGLLEGFKRRLDNSRGYRN